MDTLDRIIAAAGTASELARKLGEFPQNIHNWRKRGIPAEKCAQIEAATGIRCEDIRPDLTWLRSETGEVTGYVVSVAAA